MDKMQELFDEASDRQSLAKQKGKTGGFISGCITVFYFAIAWVGLSIFLSDPNPQATEIEEIILPTFFILLIIGLILLLIYVFISIFAKEEKISLDKIKNQGINRIVEVEYDRNFYRNFTAGIGASIVFFATTFYLLWHGFLNLVSAFEYSGVLFHIYRIGYIILFFYFLNTLKKIEKKQAPDKLA